MPELLSLISTMHEYSQNLIACLNKEKDALDTQDYDVLSELAPEKQIIIDQLHTIEQECISVCGGINISKYIDTTGKMSLKTIWDSTQKLLKDCRHKNEVNGLLINRHRHINKDMLMLLTGNQQQTGQTYNSKGNQTGNSSILNKIEA